MMFPSPAGWMLLALLLLPLVGWRLFARRSQSSLPFTGVRFAHDLEPSWRQQSAWLPGALRLAAIALLIVCLAQPRRGLTTRVTDVEGVAIEIVLDRSGSMEQDDFRRREQWVTRLAAVKQVARRFIAGDGALPGRPRDMIGLVVFAGVADNACPLTLDHDFLLGRLETTGVIERFQEDGTATGDALGLAVERLHALDQQVERNELPKGRAERRPALGKVVILLTDGENNAGALAPLEAARLAAALDARVYAISVGPQASSPGEQTLRQIATMTGGRFFAASDTESLVKVYQEIDRLETRPFEGKRYLDYREMVIEGSRFGPFWLPPLALAVLALLCAQAVLDSTILRRIP